MRWIYEREFTAANKCCFCCHIRTGTLIFGLIHLVIQVFLAAVLITGFVRPDLMNSVWPVESTTPLSVSQITNSNIAVDTSLMKPHFYGESRNYHQVDNLLFGIVFISGLLVVTVGLIYGVITGRTKYMMPFFCLQLLDIGISGMAMLSYFSSVQELKRWIAEQDYLPVKETILQLNDDHLMVVTMVIFVAVVFCKMYFIGVVWSCYKYLQHYARIENYTFRRYNLDGLNNIEDSEMLLPPKYEDVILMPNPTHDAAQQPPPPAYSDD